MVNYINGKVYKIIGPDVNEACYVGSTTKKYLSQRMAKHRSNYKFWQAHKTGSKTMAFMLFDQYGIDNCKIVLLEKVVSDSKDELRIREQHYIDTLDCVNKKNAYTSSEDRAENKRIHGREDYEKNKEAKVIQAREYRKKFAEQVNQRAKEYRLVNAEAIKIRKEKLKQENKDKFVCKYCDYHTHECSRFNRHKKSISHGINLLKGITTWLKEHEKQKQ